jgi:branched-chain amino acid transport system ATP-binding protein
MAFVMGLCDKLVVMDHGLKIAEGAPEEIRRDLRVIDALLGQRHRSS